MNEHYKKLPPEVLAAIIKMLEIPSESSGISRTMRKKFKEGRCHELALDNFARLAGYEVIKTYRKKEEE